jgi:hypothetical protein
VPRSAPRDAVGRSKRRETISREAISRESDSDRRPCAEDVEASEVTDEPLAEGLEPYVSLQTLPSGDGWKLYSSRAEYVASPVGLSDGWRGGGVGTNGCWNGCGCVAGVDAAAVGKGVALGVAVLDTSALTGESLPVTIAAEAQVMSGATNAGEAFDLLASRAAAESTFAGILRLVEQAQASRAPMARLADRWAIAFLAVTLAIAAIAWFVSHDARRVLAVLVGFLLTAIGAPSALSFARTLGPNLADGLDH